MEFPSLLAGFKRPRNNLSSEKFLVNFFVWLVQRIRDPLYEKNVCTIWLTAKFNIAKMDEKERDFENIEKIRNFVHSWRDLRDHATTFPVGNSW